MIVIGVVGAVGDETIGFADVTELGDNNSGRDSDSGNDSNNGSGSDSRNVLDIGNFGAERERS